MEVKRIVEAILFAANRTMTCKEIQQVFPEIDRAARFPLGIAREKIHKGQAAILDALEAMLGAGH